MKRIALFLITNLAVVLTLSVVGHLLGLNQVVGAKGLDFGALLSGAVLTEQVFSVPGFGKLIVDALSDVGRLAVWTPTVEQGVEHVARHARPGDVVLVIGAGGLGSPAALYLAAAGVGRIGVVDFDVVDYSNLQRQIIHGTSSIGKTKLQSAKERLLDINPHIQVDTYETALTTDNAFELFGPYDVILDGTDNFPTRYLVNDASLLKKIPVIYGAIFRFEGQVTVFDPYNGPCYRCLLPEPPPPELARPRPQLPA